MDTEQIAILAILRQQQLRMSRKRGHAGGAVGRPHKIKRFAGRDCPLTVGIGEEWCAFWMSDEREPADFKKKFRVPRELVVRLETDLHDWVSSCEAEFCEDEDCDCCGRYRMSPLPTRRRRDAVSCREKILVTLMVFGSPTFNYKLVQLEETCGRGESTIRKCITIVTLTVTDVYLDTQIVFPDGPKILEGTKWFFANRGMPMAFVAMDGKHFTTTTTDRRNKNYKKEFSMNLLWIANHEYKFIWVSDILDGSNTDGRLWSNTTLSTT